MFGFESARDHAYTLCPKCVGGRWRRIDSVENRVHNAKPQRLNTCLQDVLADKLQETQYDGFDLMPSLITQTAPCSDKTNDDWQTQFVLDEIALGDSNAYQAPTGRWTRLTLTGSSAPLFSPTFDISEAVRMTSHLHNFLDKVLSQAEIDTEGRHLAQLVWGKALLLATDFDDACHGQFSREVNALTARIDVSVVGQEDWRCKFVDFPRCDYEFALGNFIDGLWHRA